MWWERGCNLSPDPRRKLAAFSRGRDSDLKRAVGMCGEKCEGAQIGSIGDIDWYAQSSAKARDVGCCGELEDGVIGSRLPVPT